jgi:hypothetical protein
MIFNMIIALFLLHCYTALVRDGVRRCGVDTTQGERQGPAPDDLLTVEEAAAALGRSPRTVWDLARERNLPRYRIPARGKTTFLRWGDVYEAYHTPHVVDPQVKDVAA